MTMKNSGMNSVKLSKNSQVVTFNYPVTKVSGLVFGSKTVAVEGTMTFTDEANNLQAHLIFQKQQFQGVFYKRDCSKAASVPTKLSQIKDMGEEIARIEGNWTKDLVIGGVEYWNMAKVDQIKSLPVPNPLPSDSRFREDLIWLKRGSLEYAQGWKEVLEEQQRLNRQLRQR